MISVDAPPNGSVIDNVASVGSPSSDDFNTANDVAAVDTTVIAAADLAITKSDSADPINAGETLTYTLAVVNNGPSEAVGVMVTDSLPANVTFVSAIGNGWICSEQSQIVSCSQATMAASSSESISIVVKPTHTGSYLNEVELKAQTADLIPTNNADSETTFVIAVADLSVSKVAEPEPVLAAAPLTYTVSVTNSGPSEATDVVVTDLLPSGVTFVSANGSGWDCGQVNNEVRCTVATLAIGVAAPIEIVVTSPPAGGTIVNTVNIASTTSDPDVNNNSGNNVSGVESAVIARADLVISKADVTESVYATELITWEVTVENLGPSSAEGVRMVDTLPTDVSFVSVSGDDWTCSEINGQIDCVHLGFGVGTAPVITIVGKAPDEGGDIVNRAAVGASTLDTAPENNTTNEITEIVAVSDLSIEKSADPMEVLAAHQLTYTLSMANAGPSTAASVIVTDSLPINSTYVSAAGDGWLCGEANGDVTCTRPTLAVGTADEIIVVVTTQDEGGTIANGATIGALTADFDTGNNAKTINTLVIAHADLQIVKDDINDGVQAAEQIDYTVDVYNNGPSTATALIVTDTLPANVYDVSVAGADWQCVVTNGTARCVLGSLMAGSSAPTIMISYKYDEGGTLVNSAEIQAGTLDLSPVNNIGSDSTTVTPINNLSISMVDASDPVYARMPITYTLTVTNSGPSSASDVRVTNGLPNGTAYIEASGNGWSCTELDGVVTCLNSHLPANASSDITIVALAPVEGGSIVNAATVDSSIFDTNVSNNTSTTTTSVISAADLAISINPIASPIYAGVSLSYIFTISNFGASQANLVRFEHNLPDGVVLDLIDAPGWDCSNDGGAISCLHLSMAAASSANIAFHVIPMEGGIHDFAGAVTSPVADLQLGNNHTDAGAIDVRPIVDLSLDKRVDMMPTFAGAPVIYKMQVNNLSGGTAYNVVVSDELPDNLTFSSAYGDGWDCDYNGLRHELTCQRTSADSSIPVITLVMLTDQNHEPLRNTGMVSAENVDPNLTNNSGTAPTSRIFLPMIHQSE